MSTAASILVNLEAQDGDDDFEEEDYEEEDIDYDADSKEKINAMKDEVYSSPLKNPEMLPVVTLKE